MRYIAPAMLLVTALIHLLPLFGVLGVERLATLYGIAIADPNLEILLRHRAVLFGVLGGLLVSGAFIRSLRLAGFIAGFVSVASFLLIAWQVGGYNAELGRVAFGDLVALVCLVIGFAAHIR